MVEDSDIIEGISWGEIKKLARQQGVSEELIKEGSLNPTNRTLLKVYVTHVRDKKKTKMQPTYNKTIHQALGLDDDAVIPLQKVPDLQYYSKIKDKGPATSFRARLFGRLIGGTYGSAFTLKVKKLKEKGKSIVFDAKRGNNKPISTSIMIINTSPAVDCVSRNTLIQGADGKVRSMCEFCEHCYALGDEIRTRIQYGVFAGIGNVENGKRKNSAMVRKMIHEFDPQDFANALLNKQRTGPGNSNTVRFVRWNEAGDVASGKELLWIARSAGKLFEGIITNSKGERIQKYWTKRQEENNIKRIYSTIYTHRTDVYLKYLDELNKLDEDERRNIEQGFTIMGSSFMATNEFRPVPKGQFTTKDNIDGRIDVKYLEEYDMVFGVAQDAKGEYIEAEDDDLYMENELLGDGKYKLFPIYHCSSNCELCEAQYGVALCYAPDLQGAIIEEQVRQNDDKTRNIMRNAIHGPKNDVWIPDKEDGPVTLRGANPEHYIGNNWPAMVGLVNKQKKNVMGDRPDSKFYNWEEGKFIDGELPTKEDFFAKSEPMVRVAKLLALSSMGQHTLTDDEVRDIQAFGGNRRSGPFSKPRNIQLDARNLAYLQHYFDTAYQHGEFAAFHKGLTMQEWIDTYGKDWEKTFVVDPTQWGKRKK